MSRLLQKKNLLIFSAFTAVFHAVLSLLDYFINTSALRIADQALLGLLAAAAILYFAYRPSPLRAEPAQILLILYLVWYVICCLSMGITYKNDWVNYNAAPMIETCVAMLLLFPLGCALARSRDIKALKILPHICLLGWTIFILYVLIFVFQGKTIPTPNGGLIRLYKHSLQLNCNRNTTGAWEIVFFIGCCIMASQSRRLGMKAVYSAAALVNYIALVLANSRTAFISVLFGWMAFVGIILYNTLRQKQAKQRLIFSLAAAILAGIAFYFLRNIVNSVFSAGSRSVIAKDASSLNSRTRIWRYTIKGLLTSVRCFLCGVTPPSVTSLIEQASDGKYNMYTHNQFLEVAAATGVPGLCLFLAWLALIAKDVYQLVFVKKDRSLFLCVPVLIGVLLLANMPEATLLYYRFITGYLFFFLCGLLHGTVRDALPDRALPSPRKAAKKRKA